MASFKDERFKRQPGVSPGPVDHSHQQDILAKYRNNPVCVTTGQRFTTLKPEVPGPGIYPVQEMDSFTRIIDRKVTSKSAAFVPGPGTYDPLLPSNYHKPITKLKASDLTSKSFTRRYAHLSHYF